jgi:SAM-dependent methyltransferase
MLTTVKQNILQENFAPYDEISGEYYSDAHKTCRNFDLTTIGALRPLAKRIPAAGLILDIGCGKGRCIEYLGVDSNRIVQLDNSRKMLSNPLREDCLVRVLHDAQDLPFLDETFSCVTSFLCDPFFGLTFLAESFRVLKNDGLFIATTPSYEWGLALRTVIGIDHAETRFKTINGESIQVPSVLVPSAQIVKMLEHVGFESSRIEIEQLRLPESAQSISKDIEISASLLKRQPHNIDLITLIVATK